MLRSAASLLVLSMLLAGCASWSLPDAKSQHPQKGSDTAWWHALEDEGLNTLMSQLAGQNLSYKIAEARLREAQAQATAARGGLFPSIDATGSATRGERLVPALATTLEGGLQASWDVDLFGVNRNASAAARMRANQASLNQDDTLRLIRAELAKAVVDQRSRSAERALLMQLATNTATAVSLTQDLARVGLVGPDSLEQTKAQAFSAQQRLHLAEAAAAETGFRLARLLAVSETIVLPEAPALQVPTPTAILNVSLTSILKRPDVAAAQAGYLASQRDAASADAALWPRITVGGFFGAQENSGGAMPIAGNPVWSLSSGLTAPILNFGQLRGAARAAEARSEAAMLAYEDATNRALEEARGALAQYLEGVSASRASREALQRQESSEKIMEERQQRGLASQLDVLAANNTRIEQALQFESVLREVRSAYINAWTAIGQ